MFFVFRDSYILCYICYEHLMYVSLIAVSGYGTGRQTVKSINQLEYQSTNQPTGVPNGCGIYHEHKLISARIKFGFL